MLTTREIAIVTWSVIGLVWALWQKSVRENALEVLRRLLHPKVWIPIVATAGYVSLTLYALSEVGFWKSWMIKDRLLWFLFTGLVSGFSLITVREDKLVRTWLVENIGIILIIEFITGTYTLPLAAELVLVPVLVFVGLLQGVAGYAQSGERVDSFLNWTAIALTMAIFRERGRILESNSSY